MEAAAALTRFGQGDVWVLPALKDAYVGEPSEFVRGRLALSISTLKTSAAAGALTELLEEELKLGDVSFSVSALCDALGSLGVLAIHELPQINRLIEVTKKQRQQVVDTGVSSGLHSALPSLQRVRNAISLRTQMIYASFLSEGERYQTERPLLGRDSIECRRAERTSDDVPVVFDKRVNFIGGSLPRGLEGPEMGEYTRRYESLAPRLEVRCVLFEREPGAFVCIAVWDHFATSSLLNKFEYFARDVVESLSADTRGVVSIEFGIFQPMSERNLDGEYTGVRLSQVGDSCEITAWLHDSRLEELFGQRSPRVRELLRELPAIPEDFTTFFKGNAQDAAAEARLAERRRESSEGRLDYTALNTQFCDQVREARSTGRNSILTRPSICGDTFDPAGNADLFAAALPKPIQELVLKCQRLSQRAVAMGTSKLSPIEWPDIASIPLEFIVPAPRPFELAVADGIPQITLALDPSTYGIVLFRCMHHDVEVCVTNVPFSVFEQSDSFSWGYRGMGSLGLARNIINAFVPPGFDGMPEVRMGLSHWGLHKQTFASHTAEKISSEFYEQMLAKIPSWGGVISAQRIKAWILSQVIRAG
jgi:hypothetical protein